MTRYLLELKDEDGEWIAEVLYSDADGVGLVDPDGSALSYGQIIALYGREWRVLIAERETTFVRIICEVVPALDVEAERIMSDRVEALGNLRAVRQLRRRVIDG